MSVPTQGYNQSDFKSRDWLLFSQEQLALTDAPNASVEIIETKHSKVLRVGEINEDEISNLRFISNNDKSNNYGYIQSFIFK